MHWCAQRLLLDGRHLSFLTSHPSWSSLLIPHPSPLPSQYTLTLTPHLSPSPSSPPLTLTPISVTHSSFPPLTLTPHPHHHPSPSPLTSCPSPPPGILPSLGMRCSRIDLLVLDGSGLLLHDDTVLAIEGKPLKIGCYCGSVKCLWKQRRTYSYSIEKQLMYLHTCMRFGSLQTFCYPSYHQFICVLHTLSLLYLTPTNKGINVSLTQGLYSRSHCVQCFTSMPCRNNPNTMVKWLRHNFKDSPVPVKPPFGTTDGTRMAIEDGYPNQSVFILHLDSVTTSNSGVYVCRDQIGFMQRTVDILQLGV